MKTIRISCKTAAILVCLAAALISSLAGCRNPFLLQALNNYGNQNTQSVQEPASEFTRQASSLDFSSIVFTPWYKKGFQNIERREKKPYTIMVYMNGSDLESQYGAATSDLIEMLDSGVESQNLHLVVFTGGTLRWQNNVIPSSGCAVWEINDGRIAQVAALGSKNMGNPGTLAGFIDFTTDLFPADKTGLILWDHGGGSIAGFGHDEKYQNGTLTLMDMNYAFEQSVLKNSPLEFIGFDSCLMATVEMAVVASDYSKFLIASEEVEPGDGWDYSFLNVLNGNPQMGGNELGQAAAETFIAFYGRNPDYDLTLSVSDLNYAKEVMQAMDTLMRQCSEALLIDRAASFKTLAAKRNRTKTFGGGSPRDNESDMVDVSDMAAKLSDLYPGQAAAVTAALGKTVIYNKHNSDTPLGGLSAYYVYGGKKTAKLSLDIYTQLKMGAGYTGYLSRFFNALTGKSLAQDRSGARSNGDGETAKTELSLWREAGKDGYIIMGVKNQSDSSKPGRSGAITHKDQTEELWPQINGRNVCLYKINGSSDRTVYAVPAQVNGRDADIIIVIKDDYPDGRILGVRNEEGFIIQKGYDPINCGDKIAFYYPQKQLKSGRTVDAGWHKGDEFEVSDITLEWKPAGSGDYYSIRTTDLRNNESFGTLRAANKEYADLRQPSKSILAA